MSIKVKISLVFTFIFLIVGVVGAYSIFRIKILENYLNSRFPVAVKDLQDSSRMDIVAQLIRYDDEVLTQSARNYAFTADKIWKDRYDEYAAKLDLRIEEAIEYGDSRDKQIFSEINTANIALIDIETKAFLLVDNQKPLEAQKLLDSREYKQQKDIYKSGIEQYLSRRGSDFDSATAVSTRILEEIRTYSDSLIVSQIRINLGFIILFMGVLMILIYFIVNVFMKPLKIFRQTAGQITQGNLDARVIVPNQDEIGDFAKDFNQMTNNLKDSITNIENKVKARTEELNKINHFMTGRELKMIELKKQIIKLKK